jgi:hypothetical protein
MSFSFSALGSAIGSTLSAAGTSLTPSAQNSLIQSIINVVNPNVAKEKTLLAQMAAFVHTEPTLLPDLARQFSEIADPALAGAISPLLATPPTADPLQTIEAVESMIQQGM